jgi:hypothetical protein
MPCQSDKHEEEELALANRALSAPQHLPWCETEEDYEFIMAELG